MILLRLFADNLLPVFLAAGAGYLLKARLDVPPRPLTHLAFFVLAPCLVFTIILDSRVTGDAILRMVGFGLVTLVGLATLTALAARALGFSRTMTTAVVVVVLLPNAGNYGLSANLFAFGDEGLAHAGLFFVTSSILTFTLGVFIASLGRASLRQAAIKTLRVPTIWAVALALLLARLEWRLPFPVERTVELLSGACIPVFLVILGMQLHGNGLKAPLTPLIVAVGMRMLGGSVVAILLAPAFGLAGAARQAAILQSAMPSAVICIILATEYDVEPSLVTSVVVVTTLLSPLILTPLLAYLGA